MAYKINTNLQNSLGRRLILQTKYFEESRYDSAKV